MFCFGLLGFLGEMNITLPDGVKQFQLDNIYFDHMNDLQVCTGKNNTDDRADSCDAGNVLLCLLSHL